MDELENTGYNPDASADLFLNNVAPLANQKAPGINNTLNTAQTLIAGNSYTGPQPGNKGPGDPMAFNKARIDAFETKLASTVDPLRQSRTVSFDASRFGHNFDRYYNHPKFKDLGFSVYRDNESLYNAKSTWLDDWRRMGSQWFGLAGQAFTGNYKGWSKWGDGTDEKDAAIMENALSIAQSSKEGLGAWFTNFAANGAYTLGIASSILLEEIALAGIEAGSMGAATPMVAARTAYNTSRFGGALSKLAKSLNSVSDAKTFWQGVKGVTSGASGAAFDFVNPLRNTTGLVGDLAAGEKTVSRLNEFAKIKKTFGAFYRDMRELNLVLSESRLEGGFAKNKVVSDATAAFIKEKGRMPNEAEAKEIYDNAEQAGVKTSLLNMPAIYLSNRIVFDTMFRGFKPVGKLINPGPGKNPFFKVVRNYGWKKGGAGTPYSMTTAGFKFLDLSLESLKGTFSRLSKEGLPSLAGKVYRYTSANLAEGLQESFQEVAQMGYTDYYLRDYYAKLYKDPFIAQNNSMNAAFDKAIRSQFSKQGMDVFLSGFLMGGGIQPIQNLVMNKGQLLALKLGKKEKFEQYKKEQEDWTKKQVEALNSVAQDPTKYARWIDQNLMLQRDLAKEYDQAVEEGDEKTANDVQQDSLFHHVHTLLQSGRYDVFMNSLEDMKNLDTKDFADAFENVPSGRGKKKNLHDRLDKVIAKAENIKDRFDLMNEEYPNPFNPNLIDPKISPEAYMDEVRAYNSFEEAKKHAMFSEYSFGEALRRIDSIVNRAASENPIGAVAAPDFSVIYSPAQTSAAITTLKAEISALSQGTPEQKKEARSKERTLEHLTALNAVRADYSKFLYILGKASQNNKEAVDALQEIFDSLDTKKIKIYDEEGKRINFKDASVPLDVKLQAFYRESLKDSYMAYVKNIAKTKNVYPLLEAINKSFIDYVDYLALDSEVRTRSEDIDALANPQILLEYSRRIAAARKVADEQREILEAEALETYRRFATNNKMMQDLLAIGVYFDPESFDEFKNNDVIPDKFIDVKTGHEITKQDPRYKEIVDIINNYEQATGKTFSGKPVMPKVEQPPVPPTSVQAPPPEEKKPQQPPVTSTGKVDISTLPNDIQEQLRAAFEKAKKDGATDFDLWIEESVIAQAIIQGKKQPGRPQPKRRATKNEITSQNPRSTDKPDAVTAPIYSNPAVLNEGETGYISTDKETGLPVESQRVTSLKTKKIPEEVLNTPKAIRSQERGNVLDDILRFFAKPSEKPFESDPDFKYLSLKDDILNSIYRGMDGLGRQALRDSIDAIASQLGNKTHKDKKGPDGKPLKYSISMTEGFKNALAEVLREIALELEEYNWNASLPALHGVLMDKRYAGSVDLLLEKNGEYIIVDLKSSEMSRRANPDMYSEDPIQLNAYADLFEQMTGKPISKLYTINMIVTSSDEGKVLNDVTLDIFRNPDTNEDTILYPITRTPVEELLGAAKPEKPEETPSGKPTPPSAPTAPVSTDAKADRSTTANNAVIAADYLFTGGKDVMISTDYLLQAIIGSFPPAGKAIDAIRIKYASKIGNIRDDIGSENYQAMMEEIRQVIKNTYTNPKVEEIFNKILDNATGFTFREGNVVSIELEKLNEEHDAEITALGQPAPQVPATTKKAFPDKYKAQIIWATPGSVNSELFNTYDVVNGDSVLKDILVSRNLMSSSVSEDKAGTTLYNALMDRKITDAEHTAIINEAAIKMREIANSGTTVITSNNFMADPTKVDLMSLPSADQIFYLEKDPEKSVKTFKDKVLKKPYIEALYNNQDIAHMTTKDTIFDMITGNRRDNLIVEALMKANTGESVMKKIKAYFSMDPETRDNIFYTTDVDGNRVPLTPQEVVNMAKATINRVEKDVYTKDQLLWELNDYLDQDQPMETTPPITEEEKTEVNDAVEKGKDFDESQGTLRNLFDEAKTKTPEQMREELMKKAGCKNKNEEAPF